MKIVITGGNGYLGARLCEYLADKGNQVIPVCFPSIPDLDDWKNKMYFVFAGDLTEVSTINRIAGLGPDVVIHLASLDHFESEKEPGLVNSVNVLPTWRLLDTCTKYGLKKFIYFSTIQVYGKLPYSFIDETYCANPANQYGLTHLLSERICDYYNGKTGTNVISVRLSNSYGEPVFDNNNCWWLAVNDLCRGAFLNKKIKLLSDGTPQRDFLHGIDVCQAICKILESDVKNIKNNTYHISSGITFTLLELAKTVQNVFEKRFGQFIPILTPDKVLSDIELPIINDRFRISNEKIKALGFSPEIDIVSGMNKLFNYFEHNNGRITG